MNPRWINRSSLRQHVGPRGVAKRVFTSTEAAGVYAAALQARPGASERRPYRAYLCSVCHRFHVGRRAA